jgi:hypothetical protein
MAANLRISNFSRGVTYTKIRRLSDIVELCFSAVNGVAARFAADAFQAVRPQHDAKSSGVFDLPIPAQQGESRHRPWSE